MQHYVILMILAAVMFITALAAEEYRTTAYDSRLMNDPNAMSDSDMLCRIPKGTRLKVLESREVTQGMMKNMWYKVTYKGKTGWCSGWNMSEPETLKVMTVDEKKRETEAAMDWEKVHDTIKANVKKRRAGHDVTFVSISYGIMIGNLWLVTVDYEVENRPISEVYRITEAGGIQDFYLKTQ